MSANFEAKKQLVAEIEKQFKEANSVVFVDYKGITVAEDTALRKELKANNVGYKVYKNRLMLKALENLNIKVDPANFEGTTAVLFSTDEVAPVRIFAKAINDYKKMDFKFGILNGNVITKDEVVSLSKVPPKSTLIAMLLGVLQGPVSALARALNEIANKQN